MKLIDIHCHILPRIDDGPGMVEEAMAILEDMHKQDICCVIATPHYRKEMFEPSMKRVLYSYKQMQELAREKGMALKLGCEYYRDEDIFSDLKNKKRPTMARGEYVLVEFSTNDMFATIRNYVYELIARGYKPIIAHVERYFSCQSFDKIRELRELGAYIQINADSVIGNMGWKWKKFCMELMKQDLVDFIASDTHNTRNRTCNLKKCADYVSRKMGKNYTKKIFYDNPLNILKNR